MAENPIDVRVLDALTALPNALTGIRRGIEKESLRVTPDGSLSRRPHPAELGSALTHPHITTDFSEAQLELITDPDASASVAITALEDVHRFVYQCIGDELLWTSSMPCVLGKDDDIPVGQYGSSNIAMAKTIYRRGLGHRYGRLMQTISGIHYNFSVPDAFWPVYAETQGVATSGQPRQDFQTGAYFGLIRNFRRYSWLLIYLFGASPAVCKSFVGDRTHHLEGFDEGTLYRPHATSLRMGRLGYQSDAQSRLHISYNSLEQYATSMRQALTQSYEPYEKIGVKVAGEYRQLTSALLQIENEFYGTIRPKRRIKSGERPLTALRERGVEYVEVRCLDLNPFLPVGIDVDQARFLDTFLLYCLLAPSPPDDENESRQTSDNQLAVVERGREPALGLQHQGRSVSLKDWGREILDDCHALAEALDHAHGHAAHTRTWKEQRDKLSRPELTPAARVIETMTRQRLPFFRFALNQSIAHQGYFREHPLGEDQLAAHRAVAADSVTRQRQLEASDTKSFDAFLQEYLAL